MRSLFRSLTVLVAVVCVIALAAASGALFASPPPDVPGGDSLRFATHGVALAPMNAAPGDTVLLVARWTAATDSYGPATSYRVRWIAGGIVTRDVVVTTLQATHTYALPALPDSLSVRVIVWAQRAGKTSVDSVWADRTLSRPVPPPPPPGGVVLDTVVAITPMILKGSAMAVGDSSASCVSYLTKRGLRGITVLLAKPPTNGPVNVATDAPDYAPCVAATLAKFGGSKLTGRTFFSYPTLMLPTCMYGPTEAPPASCLAPVRVGMRWSRA